MAWQYKIRGKREVRHTGPLAVTLENFYIMWKTPITTPRQRPTNNVIERFVMETAAPGTCPDITVGEVVAVVDTDGIGEFLPFILSMTRPSAFPSWSALMELKLTQQTHVRTRSRSRPDQNWQDSG
jgi:hypothetical protein